MVVVMSSGGIAPATDLQANCHNHFNRYQQSVTSPSTLQSYSMTSLFCIPMAVPSRISKNCQSHTSKATQG
jgi:hypothetical protein